ncbi:hypothetical protein HPB50_000844 [Hyalomma asiaticum]|uniref:Uncharacterized protein n=1 Tax=Hyalomma asiaticum TaxID=266040 RepID=A0ACB7RWB9_HYAAI|nr:hypothetical protein HPB50_000844 [Hyalomma asiaticum]
MRVPAGVRGGGALFGGVVDGTLLLLLLLARGGGGGGGSYFQSARRRRESPEVSDPVAGAGRYTRREAKGVERSFISNRCNQAPEPKTSHQPGIASNCLIYATAGPVSSRRIECRVQRDQFNYGKLEKEQPQQHKQAGSEASHHSHVACGATRVVLSRGNDDDAKEGTVATAGRGVPPPLHCGPFRATCGERGERSRYGRTEDDKTVGETRGVTGERWRPVDDARQLPSRCGPNEGPRGHA